MPARSLSKLRALGVQAISTPKTFYVYGHQGDIERARAWEASPIPKR